MAPKIIPQHNGRWFHPRDLAYYASEELAVNLDDLLISWGKWAHNLFTETYEFSPQILVNYNPPSRISCTVLPQTQVWWPRPKPAWFTSVPSSEHIARFALSTLPGCKSILVSHLSWVHPKARGQGLSPLLHKVKEKIAVDLSVNTLICTVREDNTAQLQVMRKVGWETMEKVASTTGGKDLKLHFKRL